MRGHREAASYLVRGLILDRFDVAYAYKPHHHPTLAHAFMRTIMYLDYDQRGFDYPVIPFHVNCYGSDLMNRQRSCRRPRRRLPRPAPTPRRCFDLGRAVGRMLGDSPWRAVVIGSSSLVARLPDEEAPLALPRRGVRPSAAGGAPVRATRGVAQPRPGARWRTRASTSS